MTSRSLSQKTVAKCFEKAEMMASKTNAGVRLTENDTNLLSRLKMDYDI